jgi:hypothetical protein
MGVRHAHPRAGFALASFAAALLAVALIGPGAEAAPASAADKDCADFKTQKKAQKFFKKHKPKKDPHGLDADNDGVACESNPCPCKGKASAGSNSSVAATAARRAQCDRIKLGGEQRVFYKSQMNCRKAKTYARRIVRTEGGSKPKGFKCTTGGGWGSGGYCEHKVVESRLFGWHPFD